MRRITRRGGPGGPIALGGVKADPVETKRNPKPKTLHLAKSRRLIQFECRAGEFCFSGTALQEVRQWIFQSLLSHGEWPYPA